MIRTKVLGLGSYVPDRVVTNEEIAFLDDHHVRQATKQTETDEEWIHKRTGIKQRRYVPNDGSTSTSDLALQAAQRALADARMEPSEIDCIIFGTLSPDFHFPGTAVVLQKKLGIADKTNCACFDIRQQCSAFVYGLQMADAFIRTGTYRRILLIGAELHSHALDFSTRGRDVTVLFGDGAGAVVVGRATDEAHIVLSTHIHADGSEAEILWTEYPASARHPRITAEAMAERKHYPVMNGKRVFKHAVTRMPAAIMEGMVTNNLKLTDIDMMIPHQANLRINQMVGQMIGLPPERMHNNIQKYGNTTAASIPICMHEAIELGKIRPGHLVCLVAFGAGLTWGSVFLRY